jgi:formylglycine-generating enzyme
MGSRFWNQLNWLDWLAFWLTWMLWSDERPRHSVKLTRGFWMGQTQVTQALWDKVMGANPSRFKGMTRPVENVSWFDCVRFCNKLSELEGLDLAYDIGSCDKPFVKLNIRANGYRLPTEAEWEYAAKAGTEFKYAGGNSLKSVAWYGRIWRFWVGTRPVGEMQANAWGLYDMSGNVWEWCSDIKVGYRGRRQGVSDPLDNSPGAGRRVKRGGSWYGVAVHCRVACRFSGSPGSRSQDLGLRLSRSLE